MCEIRVRVQDIVVQAYVICIWCSIAHCPKAKRPVYANRKFNFVFGLDFKRCAYCLPCVDFLQLIPMCCPIEYAENRIKCSSMETHRSTITCKQCTKTILSYVLETGKTSLCLHSLQHIDITIHTLEEKDSGDGISNESALRKKHDKFIRNQMVWDRPDWLWEYNCRVNWRRHEDLEN